MQEVEDEAALLGELKTQEDETAPLSQSKTDKEPFEEEQGETEDAIEETLESTVIAEAITEPAPPEERFAALKAVIEAAIYITEEPLTAEQIAGAIEQPLEQVTQILAELVAEYQSPSHGLSIRELAGGYKISTKAEYHDQVRRFVKKLQPPLKLSLAALETLAVIAYKQPITGPEILEIRGVQGAGVLKTLLDRKLIAVAGRKNVLGKPMMYKTTREFLVQFGLNSLAELPTLKEFEELGRLALSDGEDESTPEAPTGGQPTLEEQVAESGVFLEAKDKPVSEPGTPESDG